jgi:hypothetical protein
MHQSSDASARWKDTDGLFIKLTGLLEIILIFNFKIKLREEQLKAVSFQYCVKKLL